MQLLLTPRFQRAYVTLTPEDRKQVQKALRLMSSSLWRPGLRVKRIRGTKGIGELALSAGWIQLPRVVSYPVGGLAGVLRKIGFGHEREPRATGALRSRSK